MEKKPDKKLATELVDKKEKAPVRWELSERDKEFLRSCNISPE